MTETKFKPFKSFQVQCKSDSKELMTDLLADIQKRMSKPGRKHPFVFMPQLILATFLKMILDREPECLIRKNSWYTVIAKRQSKNGGYLYQLAETPRSRFRGKKRLWWHSSWFSDSSGSSRFTVPNQITGKLIEELKENPEFIIESPMILEEIEN